MAQNVVAFKRLRLSGWRQFDAVDIELHPALTVITGANGSGKSTLLNFFSTHFGFSRPLLATPTVSKDGAVEYLTGIFRRFFTKASPLQHQSVPVGEIEYTNGQTAQVLVSTASGVQYHPSMSNQQPVLGVHIGSHRRIPFYQPIGNIGTQPMLPVQAYGSYHSEVVNSYGGGHTGYSPLYRMKEALISMALFGEGNRYVSGNRTILNAYTSFEEVLRQLLPQTLGFQRLDIRIPDVVLVTSTGDFLLDASSGGIMTLVDLAWQLHLFSIMNPSFTVTIDEPENHLHPSMQRSLMRNLIRAFPKVQFIAATHSPFIVSAVQDSHVYVLGYREVDSAEINLDRPHSRDSRVKSIKLDTINRAGTASEILRDVLGVSTTMPEWVEDHLQALVQDFRTRPLTNDNLNQLRGQLDQLGYGEFFPEALAQITRGK